jgi:arylsulfatase A-like enzyme
MTGARPYKTAGQATGRFWTFDDQLSDPNNKPGDTLAEYFRTHGYEAIALGKVYHNANDDTWDSKNRDKLDGSHTPGYEIGDGSKTRTRGGILYDNSQDAYYDDGFLAREALGQIEANRNGTFFLAVGFFSPPPALCRSPVLLGSLPGIVDRTPLQFRRSGQCSGQFPDPGSE